MSRKKRKTGAPKPALPSDTQTDFPHVTEEERRKLGTCCAFFKAEQYREAAPDTIRESDIASAEEQIADALKNRTGNAR